MKNKFLSIILLSFILGMSACHNPEEFIPNVGRNAINNLTASFIDDDRDENSFTSEIDYENQVIKVIFPYNYPRLSDNVLDLSKLTKMRVKADLDNNAYVYPSLLFMDLSKENFITVKDQVGKKFDYKVVAEIRKSNECEITQFTIADKNLSGIINENEKTISLISLDDLSDMLAQVSISHGATIFPDPTVEALNYNQDVQLTVTAQNGVDKTVYTVKKDVPNKLAAGLRKSSAKVLWTKKLSDIEVANGAMTTTIAATDNYVVVNTRNEDAVVLDAITGNKVGSINLPFKGSLTNFSVTADDDGNILFANLAPNAGAFTIWKTKDIQSAPEEYLVYNGGLALGRKFSVVGSIEKDAIITAPVYSTSGLFVRWQVVNGQLKSTTPEQVQISGLGSWGFNADVIYTSPKDVTSDYLAAFYADPRNFCMFDGKTNSIKSKGPEISSNWVQNAVDYVEFNKVSYAVSNSVNSFSWGSDDQIYLYDLSAKSLDNQPLDFSSNGLGVNGNYGAKALGKVNGSGCGDVALNVSADGYYLYIYFMFADGYVGCIKCDCIDM